MESYRKGKIAAMNALMPAWRLEQAFWQDLGTLVEIRSLSLEPERHREKMMALSTEYLGFTPAQAVVFRQTSDQALEQLRRCWKAREQAVLSDPLDDPGRSAKERDAQAKYEIEKRGELDRILELLDRTPRHEMFRSRIEEWVDAVR